MSLTVLLYDIEGADPVEKPGPPPAHTRRVDTRSTVAVQFAGDVFKRHPSDWGEGFCNDDAQLRQMSGSICLIDGVFGDRKRLIN